MNKTAKYLVGIGIGIALIVIPLAVTFNTLVAKQAGVETARSNVDTLYQRRSDLIPQLVKTVEQAVTSERKTLDAVVSARAAATGVSLSDGTSIEEFQEAQAGLTAGLGQLIAISEAYPELKSTAGFLDLQAQLEGTENRIAVAWQDYNHVAKAYNIAISSFPTVLFASAFGHGEKAEYFQSDRGADEAPSLEFTDAE